MPVETNTFCTLGTHSLLLCTPEVTLEIDKQSGEWRQIVLRAGEREIVPAGGAVPGFDILLDGHWLAGPPELVQWEQRTESGQFALMLEMNRDPFHVRQWILVDPDGMGFRRFLELRYRGNSTGVLKAIEISLPAIRMYADDAGVLLTPNHFPFRSLDLAAVARLALNRDRTDADYAAGRPAPGGIETFPDNWNGLVGIYHEPSHTGLYTFSPPSPAPIAFAFQERSRGFAISALQRLEMILQPGQSLATTVQHVRFFATSWTAALEEYQKRLPAWEFAPPDDVPSWVTGATFYETAIPQWGGCDGLLRALPALRGMGVDALYLLPIWSAVEMTKQMRLTSRHDPSWQRRTLPHLITDFESLDPQIGRVEDIRQLVSAAHSLGMKVVLEYVFHGVSEPSWLLQRRPHWLVRDEQGNSRASHGWEPGYSLDWANPEVQDYLVALGGRQIQMFDLDGLRVASPFWKESNWSPAAGRQPFETNLAGVAIVERLRGEVKRVKPEAVLLCEVHGPAFVRCCDVLNMDSVLAWLARLGRDEISPRDVHEYLRDMRLCYPEGTLLQFGLENHTTAFWQPSPRALRGAAISRPLFAVAALAGDLVSIYHGQERGQEKFLRQLLTLRKNSQVLSQGLVLHRGLRWKGDRHLVWLRHLGGAFALITASFDSLWSRVSIEIDPDLLIFFTQESVHHRRLFPALSEPETVSLAQLRNWHVDLDPYTVVIDLFEEQPRSS